VVPLVDEEAEETVFCVCGSMEIESRYIKAQTICGIVKPLYTISAYCCQFNHLDFEL
jgi:hypothetical protein